MVVPGLALAGSRWSVGLGAGAADRYTYYHEPLFDYSRKFEFTWLASFAADYALSSHLTIQSEATYLRYKHEDVIGGGIDIGFRYYYSGKSTNSGHIGLNADEFEGLRQGAVVISAHKRL